MSATQPSLWDDVPEVESDTPEYGATVKLELGESLVGTYLGSEEVETDTGRAVAHRFVTESGEPVTVWGTHDLNTKLAKVEPLQVARIEYVGDMKMKGGRNPMKVFKVQAR